MHQALESAVPPPRKEYARRHRPALDAWVAVIDGWLLADRESPRKQRRTARRVWQRLVVEDGASLAEVTVSRYVTARRRELGLDEVEVASPQTHLPGAEAEADFGEFHLKATLTARTRVWAARRVGQHASTVAVTARALGVGWHTVMGAVTEQGTPLVDDPARLDDVTALGVDEHAWQRANPRRHTMFATGIVDLTSGRPARLLDVIENRTAEAYGSWLAARSPEWRQRVRLAALDPLRGYLNALRTHLPHATHVLDAFHVVKLGFQALDEVRRRVQQKQTGHRATVTTRSTAPADCCAVAPIGSSHATSPSSTPPSLPATPTAR